MQKYYTYFTLSSMGSSMHHTEEMLHCGQILKTRKDTSSFLQVWSIFASHIHCKKFHLGWHELLLKIHRVGKYLPLYILRAFRRKPWRHTATSIPSSSNLEALLDVSLAAVHWESPHVPFPRVYDTHNKHNKSNESYAVTQYMALILSVWFWSSWLVEVVEVGRKSRSDIYGSFCDNFSVKLWLQVLKLAFLTAFCMVSTNLDTATSSATKSPSKKAG